MTVAGHAVANCKPASLPLGSMVKPPSIARPGSPPYHHPTSGSHHGPMVCTRPSGGWEAPGRGAASLGHVPHPGPAALRRWFSSMGQPTRRHGGGSTGLVHGGLACLRQHHAVRHQHGPGARLAGGQLSARCRMAASSLCMVFPSASFSGDSRAGSCFISVRKQGGRPRPLPHLQAINTCIRCDKYTSSHNKCHFNSLARLSQISQGRSMFLSRLPATS